MAEDHLVRRVPVAPEPVLAGADYDYADSFECETAEPDAHTATEWVQAALAAASPRTVGLVRFVHARMLRFDVNGGHVGLLGFRVVTSTPDLLQLQTEGPLLRAVIVARRRSPRRATLATFLFYKHAVTPALWRIVGPLHRRVARDWLGRAAEAMSTDKAVGPGPAGSHRDGAPAAAPE